MNRYRSRAGMMICLLAALLAAGCASRPHVVVNTWSDPAYTPLSCNPIALSPPETGKPQDKAFEKILLAELRNASFNIVPDYQADYLLSYVVSDNLVGHETAATQYAPVSTPPQQTTGQIEDTVYVPSSARYAQPTEYNTETRDSRLFLFARPAKSHQPLRLAWQGTITIEENAAPEREAMLLRALLADFGKNYNGPVKVGP